MKLDRTIVVLALALVGLPAVALAQDEPAPEGDPAADPMADPTEGDTGELGGDVSAEGDAVPVEDAGSGDDKPISAKLLLGYGLDLESGSGNPWGLGFGVGGGYNLDEIYLGVRFIYYLGEDPVNVWELGIEGGYDVDLGGATLRPGLGLGLANWSFSTPAIPPLIPAMSASEMYLYIAPGVAGLFDVTDSIFLGAEARFQMVFADPDMVKALILLAHAGMRF
jgi:hypothetical protein